MRVITWLRAAKRFQLAARKVSGRYTAEKRGLRGFDRGEVETFFVCL